MLSWLPIEKNRRQNTRNSLSPQPDLTMSSEKFCLRWNDFESNISCAFRELREDKDFFDVTLACEEKQIEAHKVILSACSPFFRAVLRKNPHSHPLLYLKGVKYGDVQSVLNFMYHGEVNVAQEDLNSFLSVAEELQVKGLTQDQSGKGGGSGETPSRSAPPPSSRPQPTSPSLPPKKARPVPAPPCAAEDDEIQEVAAPIVKTEPVQMNHQQHGGEQQQYHAGALQQLDEQVEYDEGGYEDYGGYDGGSGYESNMMEASATDKGKLNSPEDLLNFCEKEEDEMARWTCNLCYQFVHRSRQNVRNHVESRHYPNAFQYSCPSCDKVCYTMRAMEVHKSNVHRSSV